jgi:hypothetical protein
MSRVVAVLSTDWLGLRRACPRRSDDELVALALQRGRAVAAREHRERVEEDLPAGERVSRLRDALAQRVASVAGHRFELVTQRDRLARAKVDERESYERHLALHKDLVPALKLRAKELRAEVRRLERECEAAGIDPVTVEPAIDWSATISVDGYEPPRYGSTADRRAAAVEFFRRVGWGT